MNREIPQCNKDDCLRRFRKDALSKPSKYCDLVGAVENYSLQDSGGCPYFIDRIKCQETKKIITKQEEVYIIFDTCDVDDGIMRGLSREGKDLMKVRNAFEKKHHNVDKLICPYCDEEIKDRGDYKLEDGEEEDICCPYCEQIFSVILRVNYTFSSYAKKESERIIENK